jgi:uncharacterized SAM-binding protein YcdF (DUF218 family)
MFLIHQIVNVLINPVFVFLGTMFLGGVLWIKKRQRLGAAFIGGGWLMFFLMCWPPAVDCVGIWLESEYPVATADSYPAADAIVVLGGGVYAPHSDAKYPYPLMTEAADRVWHGARLWHAQRKNCPENPLKIYCTGPDVGLCAPPLLRDLGVPNDAIVTFDEPLNTEQEAKQYAEALGKKKVLLVTSALHMKRSVMIFKKYAPNLEIVPAATDHQFFKDVSRFRNWRYYFPNHSALSLTTSMVHEFVGILRYMW